MARLAFQPGFFFAAGELFAGSAASGIDLPYGVPDPIKAERRKRIEPGRRKMPDRFESATSKKLPANRHGLRWQASKNGLLGLSLNDFLYSAAAACMCSCVSNDVSDETGAAEKQCNDEGEGTAWIRI